MTQVLALDEFGFRPEDCCRKDFLVFIILVFYMIPTKAVPYLTECLLLSDWSGAI